MMVVTLYFAEELFGFVRLGFRLSEWHKFRAEYLRDGQDRRGGIGFFQIIRLSLRILTHKFVPDTALQEMKIKWHLRYHARRLHSFLYSCIYYIILSKVQNWHFAAMQPTRCILRYYSISYRRCSNKDPLVGWRLDLLSLHLHLKFHVM